LRSMLIGDSAGGGGKTRQRTEKIKEKNRKLDENRTKRIEKEKVAKVDKKDEDDIHPSRRARMTAY
jgi:nucleolar protein 6